MLALLSGTALAATLLFVIHFFGLRLRQKLDFSHIQFLMALVSKTQSVRRLNNYLLLFIRVLFIASALAAFWLYLFQSQKGDAAMTGAVSVVQDTTWSMQSPSTEKGSTKAELGARLAAGAEDVSEKTASTSTSTQPENVGDTPERAGSNFLTSLELFGAIKTTGRSGRSYVLSDFQKATFSPEVFKSLPKGEAITLVSLANPKASTIYIDSVWLEQPVLLPGAVVGLSVRVAESLLGESSQVKVTAADENQKLLGATQVLVEPGQKVVAHFKVPLTKETSQKITFTVEDGVTRFDDRYFVVLPEPASVAVIPSRGFSGQHPVVQAYKAEPAFTIGSEGKTNGGLQLMTIPATGNNQALATDIKKWVGEGNSVILFPAENTQRGAIEFLGSIGLRGISEENKELSPKPLKQPDLSDAFFKQVFEKEVKNMKMPLAKPALRWQSAYHTILRFTDNSPFLSTFKVGNGYVHLFAAPIEKSSPFVTHPLFVPVLYQLALSTNASSTLLAHAPLNNVITVPLPQKAPSKVPYSLTQGQVSFIPDQKVLQNQLVLTIPQPMSKPGFYTLKNGEQEVSTIAVNIPRVESKLEGYTVAELKEIVEPLGENIQVIEPQGDLSLQKQVQKNATGLSLWKYCLILCFLCLFAEAFIISTKKSGSVT